MFIKKCINQSFTIIHEGIIFFHLKLVAKLFGKPFLRFQLGIRSLRVQCLEALYSFSLSFFCVLSQQISSHPCLTRDLYFLSWCCDWHYIFGFPFSGYDRRHSKGIYHFSPREHNCLQIKASQLYSSLATITHAVILLYTYLTLHLWR